MAIKTLCAYAEHACMFPCMHAVSVFPVNSLLIGTVIWIHFMSIFLQEDMIWCRTVFIFNLYSKTDAWPALSTTLEQTDHKTKVKPREKPESTGISAVKNSDTVCRCWPVDVGCLWCESFVELARTCEGWLGRKKIDWHKQNEVKELDETVLKHDGRTFAWNHWRQSER